jgi:hypothetical protein
MLVPALAVVDLLADSMLLPGPGGGDGGSSTPR